LIPWYLLGILNVWLLLRRLAPVRFATFAPVYAASWAASLLIPGQLGDAAQVVLLQRLGVPLAASAAAYVTDKAVSLGVLLIIAGVGAALYAPAVLLHWPAAVSIIVLVATVAVAIAIAWRLSIRTPARIRSGIGRVKHQLAIFVREPALVAANLGLTMVKWGLMTASYWFAFRAFGAAVPLSAAATIPVMSSLVGYVPVSVGGIGTSEWTAIALFSGIGTPEAAVLATYLFLRAVLVALAALVFVSRGHVALGEPRCAS
jgi:uncharacterized membrane protein YbhN (UPF0104 family)